MMPRAAYPYLSALKIEILNPSYTLSMLSIAINTIRRRAAAPLALNAAATRRTSPSIFILNSSPLRCVNSHHCMSTTNAYACDSPDGIHDGQDLVSFICILTIQQHEFAIACKRS